VMSKVYLGAYKMEEQEERLWRVLEPSP